MRLYHLSDSNGLRKISQVARFERHGRAKQVKQSPFELSGLCWRLARLIGPVICAAGYSNRPAIWIFTVRNLIPPRVAISGTFLRP